MAEPTPSRMPTVRALEPRAALRPRVRRPGARWSTGGSAGSAARPAGWSGCALAAFAATLWGTLRVPGDPGPAPVAVPGAVRLLLELGFFGGSVVLLASAGQVTLAAHLRRPGRPPVPDDARPGPLAPLGALTRHETSGRWPLAYGIRPVPTLTLGRWRRPLLGAYRAGSAKRTAGQRDHRPAARRPSGGMPGGGGAGISCDTAVRRSPFFPCGSASQPRWLPSVPWSCRKRSISLMRSSPDGSRSSSTIASRRST